MEAAGIEPASESQFTKVSPSAVTDLILPIEPPVTELKSDQPQLFVNQSRHPEKRFPAKLTPGSLIAGLLGRTKAAYAAKA